jgi:hypothetical protein
VRIALSFTDVMDVAAFKEWPESRRFAV